MDIEFPHLEPKPPKYRHNARPEMYYLQDSWSDVDDSRQDNNNDNNYDDDVEEFGDSFRKASSRTFVPVQIGNIFSASVKDYNCTPVLKFSTHGPVRQMNLFVSEGQETIRWNSKMFSFNMGITNKINANRIRSVVIGQSTPQFARFARRYGHLKEKSFSVFYFTLQGREKSLNVTVNTVNEFKLLLGDVEKIISQAREKRKSESPELLYLRDMWDRGDKDGDGELSAHEIFQLICSMNISMPTKALWQMFEKFDKDHSGTLDFDEFTTFVDTLRQRDDLKSIWRELVIGKKQTPSTVTIEATINPADMEKTLNLAEFCRFWMDTQQEIINEQAAIDLINESSPVKVDLMNPKVTYLMWYSVIISSSNDIFDPHKASLYQDMSHPLTHYFIAASHNTYLEGDQLLSNSSVKRYIDDLRGGCRCVELDCWDGDKGEPIIYHGHTLTSKIMFEEVIQAIHDYAFENSPFPVILSIENHCGLAQQQRMASIMKKVLGKMLEMPLQFDHEFDALCSPEDLQGKVLVKGTRVQSCGGDGESEMEDGEDGDYGGEDSDDHSVVHHDDGDDDQNQQYRNMPSSGGMTMNSTGPGLGDAAFSSDRVSNFGILSESKDLQAHPAVPLLPSRLMQWDSSRIATQQHGKEDKDQHSEAKQSRFSSFMRAASRLSASYLQNQHLQQEADAKSVGSSCNNLDQYNLQRLPSATSQVCTNSHLTSGTPRGPSLSRTPRSTSSSSSKSPRLNSGKTNFSARGSKTHPDLSDVTYLLTGAVSGFDSTGNRNVPIDCMGSFSETTTMRFWKDEEKLAKWILHNERHLSRVFPKGTRVDSSNYDPAPAWAAGNQLVALNYQTGDVNMQVNRGRFRENDNCGYVLKPEYLLNSSVSKPPSVTIHINILSASQLPKINGAAVGEVIDPYVVVSVHGVPHDYAEGKTNVINNNGFNPIWNEVITFKISDPEVAIINFEVKNNGNHFIAFVSVPLTCLRPGLRTCPLYNSNGSRDGDFLFASLCLFVEYDKPTSFRFLRDMSTRIKI